jgi:3-oxoacyl-(acyl-carrier-protein) synthase
MTRVVVSGLGVVSPYGVGVKTFWAGLARGDCAIRPLTVIDTEGLRSRIAAEVPAEVLPTLGVSRRRSRADRIALAAAREALAEAGLTPADRAGMGLFVGAVGGGMLEGEEWYCEEFRTEGHSPRLRALRSILPVSHAESLAWRLRLGGPRETVVMACASGAASIALGADMIRSSSSIPSPAAPSIAAAAACPSARRRPSSCWRTQSTVVPAARESSESSSARA